MIPKTDTSMVTLTTQTQPSHTYALDAERGRIYGMTDKLDAMRQAVYLVLRTERYTELIYSWNYGTELASLIGQPPREVQSELKRRVREALLQDDRITDVDSFVFTIEKKKVHAAFVVHTVFGDIESEVEI